MGLAARILRTCTPHTPPKHDVLRSNDVLHSIGRAHRGGTTCFAGAQLLHGTEASQLVFGCSPTQGKHTNTAGTRPPGFLSPEAQVSLTRNRAPRSGNDRDLNAEDEEGVEHGWKRMPWSNTIRRRQLPCDFNCQCRRDETRRGRTRNLLGSRTTPEETRRRQRRRRR